MELTYDPNAEAQFSAWKDVKAVRAFDDAVRRYLEAHERFQPADVLNERVKLHAELEELLGTAGMTTLHKSAERLRAEGMTRAEMLDGLVALTASFGLGAHDEERSMLLLHALGSTTAAGLRGTFPDGPGPVIAVQLALHKSRERNQRRRKRR